MITSLLSFFRRPATKPPTVHQSGIQARAIRHLISHGRIDAWTIIQMGTTDAHKMLTRMRRIGLLYEADDIRGHTLRRNASGSGYHRVHFWTGKVPPGWKDAQPERRCRKRGGVR